MAVTQAEQYRQFAADCRRMAAAMRGDHALMKMVETWTALAEQADQKNNQKKDS